MEATAANKKKVFGGDSYHGCFGNQAEEFWDAPDAPDPPPKPTPSKVTERKAGDRATSSAMQVTAQLPTVCMPVGGSLCRALCGSQRVTVLLS